ncbi:hypothetical protein LJR159_000930 [Pseudomonas brassicacearum]|uniref:hypothetical protein n=1 Tax=Pseudomonas brassicacearum TaxID=930166 RepID=UPI003ECC4DA5
MSNPRLFQDYHLPNGIGLATNPSNNDSENKNLDELLEGVQANSSTDEFTRLLNRYEKSLSSKVELGAHSFLHDTYYQKMYSLLTPIPMLAYDRLLGGDHTHMGRRKTPEPSEGDNPADAAHTEDMTDITRDELKAHLENQDLKVDARLGKFEQRVSDGLTEMNHSLQLLDKDLAGLRGLKGTIILNSVLSVIAVVGIVIAVMSYGTSSFDSGRDTSQLLQELRQQSFENKQMLEQIKANQTPASK